jgi:hypothetical protein
MVLVLASIELVRWADIDDAGILECYNTVFNYLVCADRDDVPVFEDRECHAIFPQSSRVLARLIRKNRCFDRIKYLVRARRAEN